VSKLEYYEYNYSKLRGRIIEKFENILSFCKEMQISEPSIYSKLKHRTEFTQSQIVKSCILLDIKTSEIPKYFFEYTVKKNLTK
jgi:hypothetical protein